MSSHESDAGKSGALIWDLPLRLCHWLLVLAVLGCWVTYRVGIEAFNWHVWCGYAVLVLAAFRIVWGFVGPRHARFANFVRGPASIGRYARTLFNTDPTQHYAGHNPLGALMVVLILVLLGVEALTGLFANDEVVSSGPLYGYVEDATSDAWSRVHRLGAKVVWVAVWLHIAAVLSYLLVKHDNLILPMITGRKHRPWLSPGEGVASSQIWRALLTAAICAALVYWLVATAPSPSLIFF
jgi:cytochrome b